MVYMNARRRVEQSMPAQMMLGVFMVGVRDQTTELFKATKAACLAAAAEPLEGMTDKERLKLLYRIQRVHKEVTDPYVDAANEGDPSKIGLIQFHVFNALLGAGYIVTEEGHPFHTAITQFMNSLEEHASVPARNKSAIKQARKMLAHFQKLGYYHGVEITDD